MEPRGDQRSSEDYKKHLSHADAYSLCNVLVLTRHASKTTPKTIKRRRTDIDFAAYTNSPCV
jgi:hypothetical protein